MSRRLFVAIPLTIIALAGFAQILTTNTDSGLPLNITRQGASLYVSAAPGVPMPSELKTGDKLIMQQMTPIARAAVLAQGKIKAGLTYDLVLQRGGHILNVPVTTRITPITGSGLWNLRSGQVLYFVLIVLALLAIWRGRNLAAWGLGLFSVAIITTNSLRQIPLPATGALWLGVIAVAIVAPLILLGLYLLAYSLSADSLHPRSKHLMTIAFALCSGLFALFTAATTYGDVYARSLPLSKLTPLVGFVFLLGMVSLAFLLLALGYAHARAEQRLRMRWILYSTGGVLVAFIVQSIGFVESNPAFQVTMINIGIFIFILAVIGYTYAVLRQRLVEVRVVLNRTLVYGVITAIVVGVFAAINSVVEHATLGKGAGLLLELIVPLALGIVLGTLRKYVDTYINRWLFRRQYRAEQALNDFARTCGYIEQPERLLDLTVRQVFDHSRARGVALYERDAQGYVRVRQQGDMGSPARVEVDDLVFVKLRAGDHEADLHEVASALGTDGYVFSMAVRGKLIGALVCGPRPAEQYTADERALLFHVAQQVGAALHALRSREHENFVDSVARGALDAESARERARKLMAAWQTA